jgi:hypothetical protein
MDTDKSCSLEQRKEMKDGMSLVLKILSDKTFVPDKKYEKKLNMQIGGGKGLFGRMAKHDPAPISVDVLEETVVCIISFTLYVLIIALAREISWEAAAQYIGIFRNNTVQNIFHGNASAIEMLEYGMSSINTNLNELTHICISEDFYDQVTRASYEALYYAVTGLNDMSFGRSLCADVVQYQFYKQSVIGYIRNLGPIFIELLSKGITGRVMFVNIQHIIRDTYNRPQNVLQFEQCALDSVYEGKTDFWGNPLEGGKRQPKKTKRKKQKSSKRYKSKSKKIHKSRKNKSIRKSTEKSKGKSKRKSKE